MASGACGMCQLPATQCCSGCHVVFYCCRDHQKQHWRAHKASCQVKAYTSCHSSVLGRYFVASRDIKPGEIILKERPVLVGPKTFSRPVCLGCNRRISTTYKCRGCNWPVCGPECEKSPPHIEECKLMAERGYRANITDLTKRDAAYCCITPLRCLLMKENDKTKWEAIANLESHLEERRNTAIYSILKANIVGFFGKFPKLDQFGEETILRVCGILDTNCFEVCRSDGGIKVRGVYPTAAIMSHDCTPNTRHVFADEDFTMTVIATVPIKQGEVISTTYTHTLWNTTARQAHLKVAKCFNCTCKRCSDPTELGTYIGSMACSKCKNKNGHGSMLISTEPLNIAAPWKCEGCSHTVEGRQIDLMNSSLRKEIANLNISDPLYFEKFLEKYKDTLHPTNSHVVEIKYALTQMYGTSVGYSLSELSGDLLKRKESLCIELLKIADVLDPGSSHLRGALLLEQQAAMGGRARRGLDKSSKQETMKNAALLLQEANAILCCEQRMQVKLQESFNYLRNEPNEK